MTRKEFSKIRQSMEKTQNQMAQLLGLSTKAIQSFEQGWRNIPVHVERQTLLLIARKNRKDSEAGMCWQIKDCPIETRERCPAWEFQCGDLCWFINGTICRGGAQKSWQKKMRICRQCEVFKSTLPTP